MAVGRGYTRAVRQRAIAKAKRAARDLGGLPFVVGVPRPWGCYAKRHYLDCGRTRCGVCHWAKHVRHRAPTVQERRLALRAEMEANADGAPP